MTRRFQCCHWTRGSDKSTCKTKFKNNVKMNKRWVLLSYLWYTSDEKRCIWNNHRQTTKYLQKDTSTDIYGHHGSWNLQGETFWLSFKYKYICFFFFLFLVILNCVDMVLTMVVFCPLTQLSDGALWCCNWLLNKSGGIGHGGMDPSALPGDGIIVGLMRTHRCSFIKKKRNRKNSDCITSQTHMLTNAPFMRSHKSDDS